MAIASVYNLEILEDSAQNAGLDCIEPDTLTRRLTQGPLPLAYALQCATDIATSLRALHEEGRLHGSVNADSVIVTGAGAQLLPPNGRAQHTVAGADISSFGALLYEMLTGSKPSPRSTPPLPALTSRDTKEGIRIAATRLASKCLCSTSNSSLEMQKVLTEIRLLSLQSKIREKPAPVAPAAAVPEPAIRLVFQVKTQPQTSSSLKGGISPLVFTSLPADGFMVNKAIEKIDSPPSGVRCPACGVPYVYPSQVQTWFETMLAAWGCPPLRCHRCLHRYVVILRRFKFSKGSPLETARSSPS
jgi:hypothetical protein